MTTSRHIGQTLQLFEQAVQAGSRESPFYEPWNHILTFKAGVSSHSPRAWLSVAPEYELGRQFMAASSVRQRVSPTPTTSSNQTGDSTPSLRLVDEFRKPDFIVFVNYEDDPHEDNGEEESNEETEDGGEEEEGGGEEESDKGAATGMWNFEVKVKGRDIASLWEIKPFDDELFATPTDFRERVQFIMGQALPQIQTQVRFAFTEFPHQDKISTFCGWPILEGYGLPP